MHLPPNALIEPNCEDAHVLWLLPINILKILFILKEGPFTSLLGSSSHNLWSVLCQIDRFMVNETFEAIQNKIQLKRRKNVSFTECSKVGNFHCKYITGRGVQATWLDQKLFKMQRNRTGYGKYFVVKTYCVTPIRIKDLYPEIRYHTNRIFSV